MIILYVFVEEAFDDGHGPVDLLKPKHGLELLPVLFEVLENIL